MFVPKKNKVAIEWTCYDLGLSFCSQRPKLKRIIKKYSSKKMRNYLKKKYA